MVRKIQNPRYIGITGILTYKESVAISQLLTTLPAKTRLHYGVMTGRKKLRGLPSKWNNSFLSAKELSEVFITPTPLSLNTIHYADYNTTKERVSVQETIDTLGGAITAAQQHTQAIQLDMILPPPEAINPLMIQFSKLAWILQLNPETFTRFPNLEELSAFLAGYKNLHYVLLDYSKGTGRDLDLNILNPIIEHFYPHYNVVLGGGLSGSSLTTLLGTSLDKRVSAIDAQGKLLQSNNSNIPTLDINKCRHYLQQARGVFP